MPLRTLLQTPWDYVRNRAEAIRAHLREGEREEERGGDRRWSPQSQLDGSSGGPGRDRETGSPLQDEIWPILRSVPTLTPHPGALASYEAGQIWDVTEELIAVARRAPPGPFLVGVGLSHCRWSTRQIKNLEPLLTAGAGGLTLQCGDRLQKAYFRDIQVGDVHLTFSTFPTLLLFDHQQDQLLYQGLTFDPLDQETERQKFLGGGVVLPPGGEHHFVGVCRGMMCSRLDRSNDWKGGLEINLEC